MCIGASCGARGVHLRTLGILEDSGGTIVADHFADDAHGATSVVLEMALCNTHGWQVHPVQWADFQ